MGALYFGRPRRAAPTDMSFLIKILLRILINLLSLLLADYLIRDISISGDFPHIWPALWAALLLGIVHAVIRPIVKLIALPLTILTLGLFLFVVNGLMLLLVAWLVPGFEVHGIWAAIKGALIISVASWILELVLIPKKS